MRFDQKRLQFSPRWFWSKIPAPRVAGDMHSFEERFLFCHTCWTQTYSEQKIKTLSRLSLEFVFVLTSVAVSNKIKQHSWSSKFLLDSELSKYQTLVEELQPEPSTNNRDVIWTGYITESGDTTALVCLRECGPVGKTKTPPHPSENRSGPWRLWRKTDRRSGSETGKRKLKDGGQGDPFCWRKQTKERSFGLQNKNTRC